MRSLMQYYIQLMQCIQNCHYKLGVGSGGSVESSGEREALQRVLEILPDKVIVFDVGANKGQYASLLVKILSGKELELHSFEPSKAAFFELEKNLQNYKNINIKVNNFAIGDKQEDRVLWSNTPGSVLASFTKRHLDHFDIYFSHNEIVHVKTMDAYCKEHKINHIHILKIDTEGHELDVLLGSKKMFESSAIDFVQFEFGGCNIDTRTFVQDFFYFFKQYGYIIHLITPSGFCMPMMEYSESYEQFVTTNFIAVSNKFMPL